MSAQFETDEFITLMNGDMELYLYKNPLPIGGGKSKRKGCKARIFVKKDMDLPSDIAEDRVEHEFYDMLKEKVRDVEAALLSVSDLHSDFSSQLKVLNDTVDDDKLDVAILHHFNAHRNTLTNLVSQLKSAKEALDAADTEIDIYEPEYGLWSVGIVSIPHAGEDAAQELLTHYPDLDKKHPDWPLYAMQELIMHGTCAVIHESIYCVLDEQAEVLADKIAYDQVMELAITAGFRLDQQMNAIGASGWDFLRGNPHKPLHKNRPPHEERGWHPDQIGNG